ncbi:MAG: hypothetical protein J5636_04225 [Clostridiales bacterium]|nr:hypothetical protein [Clostridiales bacterium]
MKKKRSLFSIIISATLLLASVPAFRTLRADETYTLWVENVQVTDANKDDVLGDGTVSYNPEIKTLTFDQADLTDGSHEKGACVYSYGIDLTVSGSATMNGSNYGILIDSDPEDIGRVTLIDADITGTSGTSSFIYGRQVWVDGCSHLEVSCPDTEPVLNGYDGLGISSYLSVYADDSGSWAEAAQSGSYIIRLSDSTTASKIKIEPGQITITYEPGDGTGSTITKTIECGTNLVIGHFPEEWKEPEDGRHFGHWYLTDAGVTNECLYVGGGDPDNMKHRFTSDAKLVARYDYWIVGYEDIGEGGLDPQNGVNDVGRGIREKDADNYAVVGDNVFIDMYLLEGYVLKDAKVEILSLSGEVLDTITATYDEANIRYWFEFVMPAQDVTFRFATLNTAPEYAPIDTPEDSWSSGSTTPYSLHIGRSGNKDTALDHLKDVSIDDTILVYGDDYTAEAGSVIINIKPETLEKLSEGEHKISVIFDDGSIDFTFTKEAAPVTESETEATETSETSAPSETAAPSETTTPTEAAPAETTPEETPTATPTKAANGKPKTGDLATMNDTIATVCFIAAAVFVTVTVLKRRQQED